MNAVGVVGDTTESRTTLDADVDRFRRRLSKALTVAEKFKSKYSFELEVNKELGRRNKELRAAQRDDQILLAQVRNELLLTQQKLLEQGNVDSDVVRIARELGRRNEELKETHAKDKSLLTEMMHENTSLKQQLETLRCSFNKLVLTKQQLPSYDREVVTSPTTTSGNVINAVPVTREDHPSEPIASPSSDDRLFEHFLVVGADTLHPATSTGPSTTPSTDSSSSNSSGSSSSFDQMLSELMATAVNQMMPTASVAISSPPRDVFGRLGLAAKESDTTSTTTTTTTTTSATVSAPTKVLYSYPEQGTSSDGDALAHGMCDFCLPTGAGFTARATILPSRYSDTTSMDDSVRPTRLLPSVPHSVPLGLPPASRSMVFVVEDKNNGAEGRARGRR